MTDADSERYFSSVRLPSHVDAPFRAKQFWNDNGCERIIVGAIIRHVWQTDWCGQGILTVDDVSMEPPELGQLGIGPQVPPGHRAELTYLSHMGFTLNPAVVEPCDFQLTVYRNGNRVPGYDSLKPGFEAIIAARTFKGPSPRVLAPIHFEEGDTCDLRVGSLVDVSTKVYDLRWGGWVYPISVEGEAGSIRGTLQDPGVIAPLQDPTQAIRRRRR